jgi:hypothetical protein
MISCSLLTDSATNFVRFQRAVPVTRHYHAVLAREDTRGPFLFFPSSPPPPLPLLFTLFTSARHFPWHIEPHAPPLSPFRQQEPFIHTHSSQSLLPSVNSSLYRAFISTFFLLTLLFRSMASLQGRRPVRGKIRPPQRKVTTTPGAFTNTKRQAPWQVVCNES